MIRNAITFTTPPRIVIGWGAAHTQLATEIAALGRRPLIVTGRALRENGQLMPLVDAMRDAGLVPTLYEGVPPEPDLDSVRGCVAAAWGADCVVGIGGGSVLDVAKAGAALANTDRDILDFFYGRASVPNVGKPIIAVPTTAGTGSEVTRTAVFTHRTDEKEDRRKASIKGDALMPRVALLDASLTLTCSPQVTAYAGMDAFVQAVEAYTSNGASPLTDALAIEAARLTSYSRLTTAVFQPDDRDTREALLQGSLMAGLALNTSRLGLVHGLAHPIGAITNAPHGLICAMLLPAVIRYNRQAAASRYAFIAQEILEMEPERSILPAGVSVASLSDLEATDTLAEAIETFLAHVLEIPTRLSDIGLAVTDVEWISGEAMSSGSTKANPRTVSRDDARQVLRSVL